MSNYLRCLSYFRPELLLLLQDAPNYSLLSWEPIEPTALQPFSTGIPLRIITRGCRVSVHPQLFMCFPNYFGILSDLPIILSNHCSANTCLLALWILSICLTKFSSILCHRLFEHLIRYVCVCLQSSITTRILPFGSDVTPDMSWCSANQTLIECRSMSIQLTCPWSEPLLLIHRFGNYISFAFLALN